MKTMHFEFASFFIYIVVFLLLVTRYRAHRDYLYAMIGCTLIFPFEWFADNYLLFMDYDWGFIMLVDRLPLMMPFAYGWFFSFPLIICLHQKKRIDSLPLLFQIIVLYVIFCIWDFAVEYSSTRYQLWNYHWPKALMIGGILPWFVPLVVACANTALYYTHKVALKYSSDKKWIKGLLIHILAYYILFILGALIGWCCVELLGVQPTFE